MDPKIWNDMFSLGLPVLEKIARPIIIYLVLILGLRLAGKRELAQLNTFDLVVLLTLSNTVQNAIIGDDTTITGGVIGAATLLIINYLVVRFVYNNDKIEKLVEGDEDILIQDGQLNKEVLKRELISLTELQIAAHRQGYSSLDEIQTATLEPEGGISFLPKVPDPEQKRHMELLARLDAMTAQIEALKNDLSARNAGG